MIGKGFHQKGSVASFPPTGGDLSAVPTIMPTTETTATNPPVVLKQVELTSWSPGEPVEFGPVGIAGYTRQLDDRRYAVLRPAPMLIARASIRPPESLMRELSRRMSECGATSVYWFWMSIAAEDPHMGLAIAPYDDEVVRRIGDAVEPLWRAFSPDNPVVDLLPLWSELAETYCTYGEVLVPWPTPSAA